MSETRISGERLAIIKPKDTLSSIMQKLEDLSRFNPTTELEAIINNPKASFKDLNSLHTPNSEANEDLNPNDAYVLADIKLERNELVIPEIKYLAAQDLFEKKITAIKRLTEEIDQMEGFKYVENPQDLIGEDLSLAFGILKAVQERIKVVTTSARVLIYSDPNFENENFSFRQESIERAQKIHLDLLEEYNLMLDRVNEALEFMQESLKKPAGHPSISKATTLVREPYLRRLKALILEFEKLLKRAVFLTEESLDRLKVSEFNYASTLSTLNDLIDKKSEAVLALGGLDVQEYAKMVMAYRKTMADAIFDTCIVSCEAIRAGEMVRKSFNDRLCIPAE